MTNSRSASSVLIACTLGLGALFCNTPPKPAIVDAGPAVVPIKPVDLVIEDAGVLETPDASDAGPKRASGGGGDSLNGLRACCAALATKSKALGASPEAATLGQLAAQCQGVLAHGAGSAEVTMLKGALNGKPVPPVCSSF